MKCTHRVYTWWSIHKMEYICHGIYTWRDIYTGGIYIWKNNYMERNTHGGDVHTERTYTWRKHTHGRIHIEGYTYGRTYTVVYTHDGTYIRRGPITWRDKYIEEIYT